jgi:DNA-binding transcriptional LysR family regulator
LNLRQLQYLTKIIEAGSLGKAAADLRISQPALTKSVRQLEETLGARLLDRGPRGTRATAFGRAVAGHARVIETEIDRLEQAIEAIRGTGRGAVAVGVTPAIATDILPRAIARVSRDYPGVRFRVSVDISELLLRPLSMGELDFVVAVNTEQEGDSEFIQEPFLEDPLITVVRRDHPLANRGPVALADLSGHRWVLAHATTPMRRAFDRLFMSQGLQPPVATVETGSIYFAKAILAETDLIGFLPHELIVDTAGALTELQLTTQRHMRPLVIIHRRYGTLNPIARTLMEEMKAVRYKMQAGTENVLTQDNDAGHETS